MAKATRYSVQEQASTAPGHCLLCRGVKGPFLNTHFNLKHIGNVILCYKCIKELNSYFEDEVEPEVIYKKVDYEFFTNAINDLTVASDRVSAVIALHGVEAPTADDSESDNGADGVTREDSEAVSEQEPIGIPSDSDGGVRFDFGLE